MNNDSAVMTGDLREQGAAFLKQGNFGDAIAVLQEATTQDGGDEGTWRLLGAAYASLNTPDGHEKAEAAFGRVVALAPAAGRNHFNLAVAQQAAGKPEAARKSLEKAVVLDPSHEPARVRLQMLQASATSAAAPPVSDDGIVYSSGNAAASPAGLGGVGSVYAPPQPESDSGTTNIGGSVRAMGLMGVGEDRGYVAPPPPPAPAPTPVLSAAPLGGGVLPGSVVPNLKPGLPAPGAPGELVFYDQMTRAQSNAYLTGAYGISNTSGMQGTVPPEIASGFNLGAAVMPFWWLRNHELRPISIGIAVLYIALGLVPFGQFIVGSLQIVVFFTLGFLGNRLGWQNRKWDDVEDFRACQRIWALWSIPRILVAVGLAYFQLVMFNTVHHAASHNRF